MEDIKIGGIYKHYKGNLYKVLMIGTNSETLEFMIVYQAMYGDNKIWIRPASMWDEIVTVNNKEIKRFTLVGGE